MKRAVQVGATGQCEHQRVHGAIEGDEGHPLALEAAPPEAPDAALLGALDELGREGALADAALAREHDPLPLTVERPLRAAPQVCSAPVIAR